MRLLRVLPHGVHEVVLGPQCDVGDLADRSRNGRREQQRLTRLFAGLQETKDAFDVGTESHVEELIGLVENQTVEVGHAIDQVAVLEVIQETAGRGHDDGRGPPQRFDVLVFARPADANDDLLQVIFVEGQELLRLGADLLCQFSRGRNDEAVDLVLRSTPLGHGDHHLLDGGNHECQGFAGAGLGFGEAVAVVLLQNEGKRFGLHGGHALVFEYLRQSPTTFGRDGEIGEFRFRHVRQLLRLGSSCRRRSRGDRSSGWGLTRPLRRWIVRRSGSESARGNGDQRSVHGGGVGDVRIAFHRHWRC
mmetsp:Transcript_22608/g.47180  ORF Transcript_22608/g.47180 Transcript_22608/m.47180 type:complete len:305 (-) Transcript_22608:276-1190(-)